MDTGVSGQHSPQGTDLTPAPSTACVPEVGEWQERSLGVFGGMCSDSEELGDPTDPGNLAMGQAMAGWSWQGGRQTFAPLPPGPEWSV